jgi:hypothetical protein
MEGPLIGGTCRLAGPVAVSGTLSAVFSTTSVRGDSCAVVIAGLAIAGPAVAGPPGAGLPLVGMAARGPFGDAGTSVDRRASSTVPHIPQKRKLSELFSPHFGQIKLILRLSFFLIV